MRREQLILFADSGELPPPVDRDVVEEHDCLSEVSRLRVVALG